MKMPLVFFLAMKPIPDRMPAWAEIRVVINKSEMTDTFSNDHNRYLAEPEALTFLEWSLRNEKKISAGGGDGLSFIIRLPFLR